MVTHTVATVETSHLHPLYAIRQLAALGAKTSKAVSLTHHQTEQP